ncbi:hypothetical protein H0E87_031347, partial [Populus deltoides]
MECETFFPLVWLEEYYHSGNRGERLGDRPPRGPSVVCVAFHIISAQDHFPFEVIAWAGQPWERHGLSDDGLLLKGRKGD